jgi:hypothetical protein
VNDAAGATPARGLRVEVVHALPDRAARALLVLSEGATVADALTAAAALEAFAGLELANAPVGIYGEAVTRERRLADHDRVEIYRPLLVDPADARRQRSRR